MWSASGSGLMPSCAPSGPMSRTSRARMRSLIRGSLVAGVTIGAHSVARDVLPVANRAIGKARRPRTRSHPRPVTARGPGALRSTTARRSIARDLAAGWSAATQRDGPLSEFSCPVRVTQVSSLWTPGGEHPVDRRARTTPRSTPAGPRASDDLPDGRADRGVGRDAGRDRRGAPPARPGPARGRRREPRDGPVRARRDPPQPGPAERPGSGPRDRRPGRPRRGLGGTPRARPSPRLRDALSQMRLVFVQVTGSRG